METVNENTTASEESVIDNDQSIRAADRPMVENADQTSLCEALSVRDEVSSILSEAQLVHGEVRSIRAHDRPMIRDENRPMLINGDRRSVFYRSGAQPLVLERGVRGTIITVNRLKHFGFIKRRDRTDCRDLFVRDASIIGDIRQRKFFLGDTCKFDIIRTERGFEAVNVYIIDRAVKDVWQMPKIPKKKEVFEENKVSGDLFRSTLTDLFREALRKK